MESGLWGLNDKFILVVEAYVLAFAVMVKGANENPLSILSKSFWKCVVPSCVLAFSWKLLHEMVATRVVLQHRGIPIDDVHCVLCGHHYENVSHLFLNCHFFFKF